MKKRFFTTICLVIIIIIKVSAQVPKTFLLDPYHVAEVKKKAEQKDRATLQLIDSLKRQADALLTMKPVSVMNKTFTPASGSKHDYMSQAPYFWYDSSKPNGLPYMRRDGVRNPEINKITDHKNLGDLDDAARILSLAYYFTGEEKYAEKAASLLYYWFFNEATKMNPNLEYAQAVPGVNTGRGIGIIETRSLTDIVDAVGLLSGSKSWTEKDTKSLQQWYSQYLNWMLTSKNGNDEHAAKNNHGTWFYVQAIDFALFTGDKEKAKKLVTETKTRLDSQMTKEGKMPLELERTNALGYSTFNIRAWFDLARIAENTGTDLWHYKNAKGATLQTALDWLTPYALGEKKWTHQQISKYNKSDIYPLLLQAADKFKDPHYLEQANGFNERNGWMTELLYKK
jgi:Alginate lyase